MLDLKVLILVVMEDTLRAEPKLLKRGNPLSLNPCCNGRYSQRVTNLEHRSRSNIVLILVVMEDTLREQKQK